MRKKLICFILMIFVISCNSVFAVDQAQVDQQNKKVESLKQEISTLDQQSNQLENQIISLNAQIEQTTQDLLRAQQEELDLKSASDERSKAAYMYGTEGYLNYLFSAENPTDFISYFDITRDILTADKENLDQIRDKKQEIQDLQTQQTEQRNTLVETKKQAEDTLAQKQQTLQQNQNLANQLSAQLASQNLTGTTSAAPVTRVSSATQNSVNAQSSTPSVLSSASLPSNLTEEQKQALLQKYAASFSSGSKPGDISAAATLPRYVAMATGTYDQSAQAAEATNGTSGTTSYAVNAPSGSGSSSTVALADLGTNWVWPLDANGINAFTITSLMGTRESPGGVGSTNHQGTDIGANYGTAILAAAAGTVEIAGGYGGYGNAVMINHNNGIETLYGHMSSIAVSQGQTVEAGQIIGFVGSTGWSTGPHLHFEVRNNGTPINGLSLYGQDIYNRLSYN